MTLRNAFDGLATEGHQLDALTTLDAIRSILSEQTAVTSVSVNNLPSTYRLPDDQVTALTPQTDALTDAQLRAAPVPVVVQGNETLTNGTQKTRLLNSDGTAVDAAHPLPISGKFTDENGAPYNATNPLPVDVGGSLTIDNLSVTFDSIISVGNTRSTPLDADETFVGTWEEVVNYAAISCAILTDANSALQGAVAQWSADGVDVISQSAATIPAGTPAYFSFPPRARYFRIVYTNGPVAQTALEVEVTYRFNPPGGTLVAFEAPVLGDYIGEVGRAGVMGRLDGPGIYANIRATDAHELRVNDESNGAYLANRYGGSKSAYAGTVTTVGDHTLVTPAAGKRLRLFWTYALADPSQDGTPLVTVKLGSVPVYAGYAISHWEVFTGGVDEPIVVNLAQAAPVAVTLHYQEIS